MLQNSAWRSKATAFLAAAAMVVQACSSNNTTTSTPGSIGLSLAPTSVTIQQGGTTTAIGTLTETNFTGAVTFTISGMVSGVTGVASLTGNTATVVLSASSTATIGADTLTVVATGAGLTNTATATFVLTVAAASASSYTMTLGSPALSVVQGASGNSTITLARTNFTGNVTLSVDNLPTGITASFIPNPATGTSSVLTLGTTVGTLPSVINLMVRGTAPGMTDVTAPLVLTVTAVSTFTVAATPAALSVVQGATNVAGGVRAARIGGFVGVIAYTLTGAPAGVTAVFAATTTTDSTQVSVSATSAVVAGVYTATITAISGLITQTTPITITVTAAASGSAIRLDFSGCALAAQPIWVAFQDGAGAWTRVTGTGNVYTFNVASTKGALAVVTPNGAVFNTTVQYFSNAEFAANVGGCTAATATIGVNGSVLHLNAGDVAQMSLGGSSVSVASNTTFVLPTVANGTFDLVGYRRNTGTPGVGDRGLLRRDQTIAANGTLAVADFTSTTESFGAMTANLTTSGGGAGDPISQVMAYLTGAACTRSPLYTAALSTSSSVPMYGVPSSQQRATDFHALTLIDAPTATNSRQVTVDFHGMGDRTVTFGALLVPTVTNVTGSLAYKRLQAALTLPSDYQFAAFSYTDASGNSISVIQSVGFLGGAAAVTAVVPDFTGTAGLTTSWFPAAAAAVNYNVIGATVPLVSACTEGATAKVATNSGTM